MSPHIHVQIQDETFLGDTNANVEDKTGLNWKLETDHTTVSSLLLRFKSTTAVQGAELYPGFSKILIILSKTEQTYWLCHVKESTRWQKIYWLVVQWVQGILVLQTLHYTTEDSKNNSEQQALIQYALLNFWTNCPLTNSAKTEQHVHATEILCLIISSPFNPSKSLCFANV